MKLNEVRDLLRNVEEQIAAAIGVLDRTLAHAPTDGGHRGYFAVGKVIAPDELLEEWSHSIHASRASATHSRLFIYSLRPVVRQPAIFKLCLLNLSSSNSLARYDAHLMNLANQHRTAPGACARLRCRCRRPEPPDCQAD